MKDTELLQYVHKTAQMGIIGLQEVESRVEDQTMAQAIHQQMEEYRAISKSSSEKLRSIGEVPADVGNIAKLSSEVMVKSKTAVDASAPKVAEMVIQGNTMGVAKSIQHLHDYTGTNSEVRNLAEKLIATEEANVEEMKAFL